MNIRNLKIFYIIGVISLLNACVEVDKTLGLDFVPDNATVDVEQEVFNVPIYTANVDSVLTSSTSIGVVGYLNHPTFGLFTAGSVFRMLPYSLGFDYGEEAVLDSAVLTVYVASRTQLDGASSVTQPLSLYQLERNLAHNTAYYSNSLKPGDYNSTKISEAYTYKGEDTIKIKLKNNFVEELLGAKEEMTSDTTFLQEFKGFYLAPDAPASTTIGGQVSYFDLTTTYITVTYHHTSSSDSARYFYYFIEQSTPNFNVYEHGSSSLSNYNSPPSTPVVNAYLEALAGVKPYINFNYVKDSIEYRLRQKGKDASKLVINKAELVVPIDYGASSYSAAALDLCPTLLTLAYRDTTNAFAFLTDTYFSTFDGALNRSLQQYSFNLTYYVQGMFTNQALYHTSQKDMYLYPIDSSYDSYGTQIKLLGRSYYACGIIKAPAVKLKLTYTILK